MTSDMKFIQNIRKQGKHAEDNLAMCDVLHLIKMVADGDLRHVDEAYVDLNRMVARLDDIIDGFITGTITPERALIRLKRLAEDFRDFEAEDAA